MFSNRCARFVGLALAAGVALSSAATVFAEERRGVISFMNDNDVYTGTDGDYSNCMQFSCLSPLLPAAGEWDEGGTHPARWVADRLPVFDRPGHLRWGLGLGHAIYTPGDTETSLRITDDRPYAGWLYLGLSLTRSDDEGSGDGDRLPCDGGVIDNLTLDLGVIGPLAQGDRVQNDWHTLIGDPETNGWRNQLFNEPGINLAYQRLWRFTFPGLSIGGLEADVMPRAGGAIVNVATNAMLGGGVRIGRGLDYDFGPPRIGQNQVGRNHFTSRDEIGWHLFADIEGRVVGRDIFLDGNSFGGGHFLHAHPFVAEARFGAALTWRHLFPRLSLAPVRGRSLAPLRRHYIII